MTTTSFEHLTKKIELVVHEHIATNRDAAEQAIARAFAAAAAGSS